MAYRDIATSEIDRNSPVREPLLTALRDNPIGIAQRDTGAPRVKPPSIEVLDTPGSGTWTVPAGVTRVRYRIVGGGGANGNSVAFGTGASGGDTTLNDGATTYTAGGGGASTAGDGSGGLAGSAFNCDINLTGQDGMDGTADRRVHGGVAGLLSPHYGKGSDSQGTGGGAGGGAGAGEGNIEVSPGGSLSYTVGGAGGAGAGAGAIILEY